MQSPIKNGGLAAVFDGSRAELLRFLVARSGNAADADDLLSELWLKVASAHPGPVANARAYLFRMANNLYFDHLRERRRREARDQEWSKHQHGLAVVGVEVADPSRNAEQQLVARDSEQRLADAIGQLPAGARRVLIMHKIDGLTHDQVATRLRISRSAVEKHMAVAMTHLRRLLSD
jgi:RNA polymerase sigma factor (sigma-70 family)